MNLKNLKFCILVILPVLFCSCKDSDGNHPLFFKAGRELRNNNIEEAKNLYLQFLKVRPNSAEAHIKLATIYDDRLNQPIKAIYHYQRYLELAPADDADRQAVPQWIKSAEHKYYLKLKDRFNDPEDINTLRFELEQAKKDLNENKRRAAVYSKHLVMYAKKNKQLTDYLNKIKSEEIKPMIPPPANISKKTPFPSLDKKETVSKPPEQPESSIADTASNEPEKKPESSKPTKSIVDSRRQMFIQRQKTSDTKYQMRASLRGPIKTDEKEKTSLPAFYKVKKGDTLSEISRKFYGSGSQYKIIIEANKSILKDASGLQAGMTLKIPERKEQ